MTDAERRERERQRSAKRWRTEPKRRTRELAKARERRTGFTQADWDARFIEQGGLCAICREQAATAADHNHATGQKRALLCRGCNASLGVLESPMLPKLKAYLDAWNARS